MGPTLVLQFFFPLSFISEEGLLGPDLESFPPIIYFFPKIDGSGLI